jgi:hypothetical protein
LLAAPSARLAARRFRLKDAQSRNYTTTSMIAFDVAHAFFVQFRLPLSRLGLDTDDASLLGDASRLSATEIIQPPLLSAHSSMPLIAIVLRRCWTEVRLPSRLPAIRRLLSFSPSSFELSSSTAASCSAA